MVFKIHLIFGDQKATEQALKTREEITLDIEYIKKKQDLTSVLKETIDKFCDEHKLFLLSRTYITASATTNVLDGRKFHRFVTLTTDALMLDYLWHFDKREVKQNSIFAIKALDKLETKSLERNIGWFSSLREAYISLIENTSLISEEVDNVPYYKYAIIEEIPQGLYGISNKSDENICMFFKYDEKYSIYRETYRPKSLESVLSLWVGLKFVNRRIDNG